MSDPEMTCGATASTSCWHNVVQPRGPQDWGERGIGSRLRFGPISETLPFDPCDTVPAPFRAIQAVRLQLFRGRMLAEMLSVTYCHSGNQLILGRADKRGTSTFREKLHRSTHAVASLVCIFMSLTKVTGSFSCSCMGCQTGSSQY
jgi:hypothetical protein